MKKVCFDSIEKQYDLLIVGAGPAGLAVAASLRHRYNLKILLIDEGFFIEKRNHDDLENLGTGFGGAGLYSDGKFSFFPSATHLWKSKPQVHIVEAFNWLSKLLKDFDIQPPSLSTDSTFNADPSMFGKWSYKPYPAFSLPFESRLQLIQRLINIVSCYGAERIGLESVQYDSINKYFNISIIDSSHLKRNIIKHIKSNSIIFASGRMGPLTLNKLSLITPVFKRLEFGIRIVQKNSDYFLRDLNVLDPKLYFCSEDKKVEWRTFCSCRDGEFVFSKTQNFWAVSGRADCAPSGISNVGFNTRILDQNLAELCWEYLRQTLKTKKSFFILPLNELLSASKNTTKVHGILGDTASKFVVQGLHLLVEQFPSLLRSTTTIVGPTLEGVGNYPQLNPDLSIKGYPAWVVGDATGIFRGLTSALVSGFFVGCLYAEKIRNNTSALSSRFLDEMVN